MLITDMTRVHLETKAIAESDEIARFTGTASTSDIDLVDDIIEAGAFGAIEPKHVAMLRDHVPSNLIGGWLSFEQDGKALKVEGAISLGIPLGRETYTLMKQGFLNGLSVGYRPKKGGLSFDEASNIRRIKKATLIECSIVSVPAQPRARIRSVKSLLDSPDALHEWLIEAGLDEREISTVIHKGFDALRGEEHKRVLIHEVDGFTPMSADRTSAMVAAVRGLIKDMKGARHVS